MRLEETLLGALAVWRLTHLLFAEDGPGRLLARLRGLSGAGFWKGLFDCFYCLSLWTAAPFAVLLGRGWRQGLLLWLALSAGAILIENRARPAAFYVEDAAPAVPPEKDVAGGLAGDP